jgi:predicted Ser/Thr protein kinase
MCRIYFLDSSRMSAAESRAGAWLAQSATQAAIICPEPKLIQMEFTGPESMIAALPPEDHLRNWIRHSLSQRLNILATSNQGTILLYSEGAQPFIVKTAMGRGPLLWIRRKTLRREYQIYCKLEGLTGIPACYGFLDQRYLLLEWISGRPYRDAVIDDREQFFACLLEILNSMHQREVAHGDLKSKGNLLVTDQQSPCVIDFGTAFHQKSTMHFINNWFFRTAKRLDLNAWVKHKYLGRYGDASVEDARLLHYNWLEILVRKLSGRPMERVHRRSDLSDR